MTLYVPGGSMQRRGSRLSQPKQTAFPSELSYSLLSKDLEAVSDLETAARVLLVPFSKVNIPKLNWGGEEIVPLDLGRKDQCGSIIELG